MEYRQLGRSGLRVSKLCLGTMKGFNAKDEKTATRVIAEAIDSGINFIDTADCYRESEETVGKALAEGGKRDKVVLATKVGWYMGRGPNDCGYGRAHLVAACEASLRRLRTDFIDLYILHVVDANTPIEEALRTLDMLVRQGKVRYIGTSKHPVALIVEALGISEREGLERFVSEQPPYNLLDRGVENDLIWTAMRHGLAITPFSPLASGLLTGRYRADEPAPEESAYAGRDPESDPIFTRAALEAIEKLRPLAEAKGVSIAELSIAWLMNQPGVTAPIVGMRTVDYLRSGLKACDVTFTSEELAQIDQIFPPGGSVSNFYEANVYRAMRMRYSWTARRMPFTGAFIPDSKTRPPRRGRRRK